MTVGSLFSGIGGFDLGLERAGMQVIWQSEIEPHCCKVLKKWWPDVPNLGNIFKIKDPPAVDLICGGFPCQPFSIAGKRKGKADDRYIWPEMLRVITEVKPRWVFAENVPGIISMVTPDGLPVIDSIMRVLEDGGFNKYETLTQMLKAQTGVCFMRGKVAQKKRKKPKKRKL
jgi:DNA-cytosine methyltransferase